MTCETCPERRRGSLPLLEETQRLARGEQAGGDSLHTLIASGEQTVRASMACNHSSPPRKSVARSTVAVSDRYLNSHGTPSDAPIRGHRNLCSSETLPSSNQMSPEHMPALGHARELATFCLAFILIQALMTIVCASKASFCGAEASPTPIRFLWNLGSVRAGNNGEFSLHPRTV